MRPRAPSLHEALFPDLPEFDAIAELWPKEMVDKMLTLVWEGFDQMKSKHLCRADFTVDYEQLERGLTSLHIREILLLWNRFSSFIPIPEECEWRKRASRSSKPLAVDIAFESVANPSVHFAIEAKVLDDSAQVSRYLADLDDKYLSGKASPMVGTAALAGYLRSGLANEVFPHLETRLGQKLETHTPFANRPHRVSRHERTASGKSGITDFTCHHLILSLSS
ncbi:MAG: hypothetical protein NTY98_06000 [Verrucomicrobia bacterium]|nr:hypothetical protein [Verrucomicrobiota bacterium]